MTEKKRAIQINPLDITESLGYTTYRRDSRKPWSKDEDRLLSALMHEKLIELGYRDGMKSLSTSSWQEHSLELPQRIDWDIISERLKTRKPKDCRKRWTNSLDPTLKKGKWTVEEDQKLLASFNKHGSSWQKISLDIPGRTDDQCAKRYIEVLDPKTKDRLRPWSIDEDLSLIRKVKTYGTKWRTISMEMESRPSLTCRNRWRKIVTDVVRGKSTSEIKKEIDSIQGGLSKIAEISENLRTSQNKVKADEAPEEDESENDENFNGHIIADISQQAYDPITQMSHMHLQDEEYKQKITPQNNDNLIPPLDATPPFGLSLSEPAKPARTDVDWKFTLKDTSGLSISSGAISTTELARQLIESAKQNDLKISIHQHIHHHYAPTQSVNGKGQSPEDSGSNLSGAHNEEFMPNRYSHFNYLPAMVRPQLESSSLETKESDLLRLLNPSGQRQHPNQHIQHQHQPIQHPQQYQSSANKRRLSSTSNNSRKKAHHSPPDQFNQYEELDEELDFWETMRSLSQVVNINSSMINNRVEYYKTKDNKSGDVDTSLDMSNGNTGAQNHQNRANSSNIPLESGMLYHALGEEDHDDLDDELSDLRGLGGFLPFNPS